MSKKNKKEKDKTLEHICLSPTEKLRRAQRIMEFTEFFSTKRAKQIRRELETR